MAYIASYPVHDLPIFLTENFLISDSFALLTFIVAEYSRKKNHLIRHDLLRGESAHLCLGVIPTLSFGASYQTDPIVAEIRTV